MADSATFNAAYVQLLARVWAELEGLCQLLAENKESSQVETQVEILRLEVILLQRSLAAGRLALSTEQHSKICEIAGSAAAACDVVITDRNMAILAIERTQNVLFDEVCWLSPVRDAPHRQAG